MRNVIVVGGCKTLVRQVLLSLRSAGDYRCIVLGGPATRRLEKSVLCREFIDISFDPPDPERLEQLLARLGENIRTPFCWLRIATACACSAGCGTG